MNKSESGGVFGSLSCFFLLAYLENISRMAVWNFGETEKEGVLVSDEVEAVLLSVDVVAAGVPCETSLDRR